MFAQPDPPFEPRRLLHFSQSSQPTQSQPHNIPSQPQPTPTGILADKLGSVTLASQPSRFRPLLSTQDLQMSQVEMLGTQDYVTPADDGPSEVAKLRSPAQLSPKLKRPRAVLADENAPNTNPRVEAQPMQFNVPGRPMRVQSPPCHHNPFINGPPEESAAAASRLPRGIPPASMFTQCFKQVGLLGEGGFSRVFRVVHRLDGKEYAVKRSAKPARTEAQRAAWLQEIQCMAALGDHPHLVSMRFAWTEPTDDGAHFFLLMDKCGENVATRLSITGDAFEEQELLGIAADVCSGLRHIHARGIAHMDVKPDNIYTTESGAFKLGDFGCATLLATSLQHATPATDEGDVRYLAAEVLAGDRSALDKADMFALGASLYELATRIPLPKQGPTFHDVRQGRLRMLPSYSVALHRLIKQLMAPKASDRPTAEAVLASSLLQSQPREAPTHTHTPSPVEGALPPKAPSQHYGGLCLQRVAR